MSYEEGTVNCEQCGADLIGYSSCEELLHQLSYYTLAHPDPVLFIHQHVVDAYMAQHVSSDSKQMGTIFSLVGLYLFTQKGYTGLEVQNAHMKLAKNKAHLPPFNIFPSRKSILNIKTVLDTEQANRDVAIKDWSSSVYETWKDDVEIIKKILIDAKILN